MTRPVRKQIRSASEIVWPAELCIKGLFAGQDRPLGTLASREALVEALRIEHAKATIVGSHVSGTDANNGDVFLPEIQRHHLPNDMRELDARTSPRRS